MQQLIVVAERPSLMSIKKEQLFEHLHDQSRLISEIAFEKWSHTLRFTDGNVSKGNGTCL